MNRRPAFTLFELILAIALSATLLALIGTAVNLYLVRMDTGRNRVEEAQLARSILSAIAADVRAATVYQTQDISTVSQLAAGAKVFDPDAIDSAGGFSESALTNAAAAASASSGGGSASGAAGASGSTQGGDGTQEDTTTTAPGLNGLANELMIDVARLPRLDELFPSMPQQASATTDAIDAPRPSDLKTVRYFIRQGTAIDPSDPAATLLSPEAQLAVGGLVRQSMDRAVRQVAEQSGNSQQMNSGQELLAPEVAQIQFIYFDGSTAVDTWDMQERGAMPTAIEVRIWITPDAIDAESSAVPLQPQMYSQTIELPMAQAAGTTAASSKTEDDSTQSDTEESGTGETSGTEGTTFGQ